VQLVSAAPVPSPAPPAVTIRPELRLARAVKAAITPGATTTVIPVMRTPSADNLLSKRHPCGK